jgi:membrane fusion protein (multidrug efflux system)
VVDDHNIARQRRVRLGQLTPDTAGIVDGLKEGEIVVVEGIQRARPNIAIVYKERSYSLG